MPQPTRPAFAYRNSVLSAVSAAVLVGGLAAAPLPALAQGLALEEVTVTARRREESLQDVPISVTAFSGDELLRQGVPDITALSQSTPNVTFEQSRATSSTLTAFIRGVGQQDPLAGFEQGVGIYLDDIYLARPQAAVFQVYDVERIEILRGPQGTLYGRNTIGGALKYVTRRLADEPEVKLRVSGGTYRQLDAVLTASTPITDSFRIGGTIATFQRNGYGTNLTTGAEHYDQDMFAARLSMEFDPTPDLSIRLFADYSDDDSNPKSGHRLTVSNFTNAPILDNVYDTRAGAELDPSTAGIGGENEVKAGGVGMNIEWQATDTITLKSITSYREDDSVSVIDFDSLPNNDFDAPVVYENWQVSQEFQLLYEGERLSGVAGFYYLRANAFNDFDVVLGNLGVTAFTGGDVDTDTWAVFGDFTYDITDRLALSFGGRYTSDERTARILRQTFLGIGSPAFGNDAAVLIATAADFTSSETFNKFTPRVSLSYAASDRINLYASYSQGFKSGGYDPRGDNRAIVPYDPEIVNTYEVGLKSSGLLDGRANANLAFFYSDYKDQQIPGSVGVDSDGDGIEDTFVGTVTNAGSSTIWGVEFEGTALVTERLRLNGSVGYINAEFDEFIVGGVDLADDRVFQNTPEWTSNVTATLDIARFGVVGREGWVTAIGSWSYRSKTFQFEIPNPLLDQPAYHTLDVSLVWESDDGVIQAGIHGRNLTDEEIITSYYFFPALGLEGVESAFYAPPRTITGTLTFRF